MTASVEAEHDATSRPSVTRKIAEIIWLAAQNEGESLQVNGKTVNDVNFRMDPLGGAILLADAAPRKTRPHSPKLPRSYT